jgi:hypothetical protein
LAIEFTIADVFPNAAVLPTAAPPASAAMLFSAVQCSTARDEQSAEHSAAVLAAHATWALTDALTLQTTLACTVQVA